MGHSKGLSERQTRDGGGRSIFNTEAKKHDKRCEEVSILLVLPDLQKKHPHLNIKRWWKLEKAAIHQALGELDKDLGQHQHHESSYIQPDGGIIVVEDKTGKWRPILITEAKVQGTNVTRIERGLKKQGTGNALERATKNIAEVRNFMIDENHFPYVLFGHGSDLAREAITVVTKKPLDPKAKLAVGTVTILKPPTIPDRITSANYGLPCNEILVHNRWIKRTEGRETMLQPASLYMRLEPWNNEEMYDIMMKIALLSLQILGSELPEA